MKQYNSPFTDYSLKYTGMIHLFENFIFALNMFDKIVPERFTDSLPKYAKYDTRTHKFPSFLVLGGYHGYWHFKLLTATIPQIFKWSIEHKVSCSKTNSEVRTNLWHCIGLTMLTYVAFAWWSSYRFSSYDSMDALLNKSMVPVS